MPMMILVAGPYRSGTNDNPELINANVDAMMEKAKRHSQSVFYSIDEVPILRG